MTSDPAFWFRLALALNGLMWSLILLANLTYRPEEQAR